ncbi:hypothetical protein IIB34_03415 [PVC group bacterium]|nr:hypothetical protein [PVC group bacterium]
MLRTLSITTLIICVILSFSTALEAKPHILLPEPNISEFIFPDLVFKQTIEYVYTLQDMEATGTSLPLISAIITSFDGNGNVTAIELKDRETLTMTERLLEDLAQDIVLGNMEKEIVSIRYELNMVGDPVSADILYFDIGELTQ